MSFIVRPATMDDLWELSPVMRPADLGRYGVQLSRSESFGLVGDDGKPFAAGGLYLDAAAGERVCWMLARANPPARDLLTGVRLICDHAGAGPALAAYVDARETRHFRFAAVLGFVSSASARAPSLPAHIVRMERRA